MYEDSLELKLSIKIIQSKKRILPANMYLFKVNNTNNKKKCELYSKLTARTLTPCY